jgi:ATP/maltotriose-dependent transcriptional regulator MalT
MVSSGEPPLYLVQEQITMIPAELVSYDKFQPDFNVERENRYHLLSPCGTCGRVRMVHVAFLLEKGQKISNIDLSTREHEVLGALVNKGLTIEQAGKELHLSASTVKTHKVNLYHKLNVHSRVQLATRARELGLM